MWGAAPGGQDSNEGAEEVVARGAASLGLFKTRRGGKTNSLLHNRPQGARKKKLPRMIPMVLAFAAQGGDTITNQGHARGGAGFGEKNHTCSFERVEFEVP